MISFESLKQIADGIADHFGTNCEVVIHGIGKESANHSILYIRNGHITSRNIGDGPSSVVLQALNASSQIMDDHIGYLTKTADGRVLRSSTIFLRNDDHIEYVLSINYDITSLVAVENAIRPFTSVSQPAALTNPVEITNNVVDLLNQLIEQSVALIGKPAALMTKDEKVKAIRYLNDTGAFLITKAGDKISQYFGISKFTLYSYIDVNHSKS